MSMVLPDGYILDIIGPFHGTKNDASITEHVLRTNNSLKNRIEDGDTMIVDRGFRDVVPVFTDLGYEVKMPYYLEKGNKQYTTLQANESRLVTKVRWTVESFHTRLKKSQFFSNRIENQMLPKLEYCIRIISACLNCYRGAIVQNYNSLESQAVAAAMKDRKGKCNTLLALIETGKTNARQRWSEIDEANIDFPLMDLDDLRVLFFGSYQIK
ncbi:unnamed protein product [Didymodactylos carnosus]|uniref:DDE Tnp4 domain-containing protein n=1 Tax=Didymodactylos carnosus TaxID=1234261 RepID=A0A8S2QTP5_9BILA|nr:unnamed protein product [Didymodactylos carnosus]CAF4124700.1 unnamed protein product [Didymodactylos carnosus]